MKKLVSHDLYRARLDDTNRLLFRLVRWHGECCALILEVILGHAYGRSRFLRGAKIDESKIPDLSTAPVDPVERLPELPYLNPANPRFHLLDKVLSFDERQEEIFRTPPPLIIIGPAGSTTTASSSGGPGTAALPSIPWRGSSAARNGSPFRICST